MQAFYFSKDFAESLFNYCKVEKELDKLSREFERQDKSDDEFDVADVFTHPMLGIKSEMDQKHHTWYQGSFHPSVGTSMIFEVDTLALKSNLIGCNQLYYILDRKHLSSS